ncbi:MAG: SMI1/KNR4 family protein [Polyangiaceae bacterium]|nr:SMI1/KNR4 family protein [Myxococcales bacterium]MCB9590771.1 SMI1/KNR4 family protein [Polyangiaceae bacterium]MCB9610382.1 SMI1/KNR4 family protein [Polyangiaceae bacterium]
MAERETKLASKLEELLERFSEERPVLRPPAGAAAWQALAERFPNGHCRRWFEACDGQDTAYSFYDSHELVTLSEAADAMRIADDIRAEPDGYWVEPQWLAIAADNSGQHIMIDDRDGRVLAVAHDDDNVPVLAESPEAWLQSLLDGLDDGSIQWDRTFGLIETKVLEDVAAYKQAQAERKQQAAQMTPKQRLGLFLTLGITMGLMGLLIWWLESRR